MELLEYHVAVYPDAIVIRRKEKLKLLPTINNKSLMECVEDDFQIILHNPDYSENQYLDYKKTLSYLSVRRERREDEIYEFRNDVCSFANADGGYIIYGIAEEEGAVASELEGIDIQNKDQFELELRDKLSFIEPKCPPVQIHFVKLHNERYLVILKVDHDMFAPYIHLEKQKYYRIYKREGNQKVVIRYAEIKNMFLSSKVLEDTIKDFRGKRIKDYYNEQSETHNRFMMFHIIPETFLYFRRQLFLIEKEKHITFSKIFSGTGINSQSLPCVDGLRFESYGRNSQAILYDNGTAEFILSLDRYIFDKNGHKCLARDEMWEHIEAVINGYQGMILDTFGKQRYFGCISIVGCKNLVSEDDIFSNCIKVDRNQIICPPVAFSDMGEVDTFQHVNIPGFVGHRVRTS